jgi:hypothetical protein
MKRQPSIKLLWTNFCVKNWRSLVVDKLGEEKLSLSLWLVIECESESESYVTTDGQSASLIWNIAPIWSLRPDLYYCQTLAGLLMWGVLSDERTGLSFAFSAGPRRRRYSRIRVPWDSRTYFTVSDSRLRFRRLLRFAWLRWRYSIPPPHGIGWLFLY